MEPPREPDLAALLDLIRSGDAADGELSTLVGRLWPGGPADRSPRAALAWLRRWAPKRVTLPAVACNCSQGRCAICN